MQEELQKELKEQKEKEISQFVDKGMVSQTYVDNQADILSSRRNQSEGGFEEDQFEDQAQSCQEALESCGICYEKFTPDDDVKVVNCGAV